MKVCDDGIVREMTAEEIAALQSTQAEQPQAEQTADERIAALESAVARLTAYMNERK